MTAPHPAHDPGRLIVRARALAAPARPWLALVAVIVVAVLLVPPAAGYARQYAWFQAVQFAVFAVAAPALLVLGIPSRFRPRTALTDWPPARRAIARLAVFIVLVIAWRLPGALDALATRPVLALAEMATLFTAGAGVWLELTDRAAGIPRLTRPGRAAVAALSMWTIWIMAYITGMSRSTWAGGYGHPAARAISIAADQQIAVAILWAVPAVCFVPVIYGLLITWLGERDDPDRELREASASRTRPVGLPRPPRGWRSP
ncbi:MAG: cytochrome c oxidase assembly protein [Streptosporangiaceae bacterium]